jgi:hypothetical protein
MTRKLIIVATALILCASLTQAQTPQRHFKFFAGGGINMPNGDFADWYKSGLELYVGGEFPLAPAFSAVGKVGYQANAADDDAWMEEGQDFTALYFGLDGKFAPQMPASSIKPYGFLGGGLAAVKFKEVADVYEEMSETKFYWNIGAGIELTNFGAASAFLQVGYRATKHIEDESDPDASDWINSIPITVGVKF